MDGEGRRRRAGWGRGGALAGRVGVFASPSSGWGWPEGGGARRAGGGGVKARSRFAPLHLLLDLVLWGGCRYLYEDWATCFSFSSLFAFDVRSEGPPPQAPVCRQARSTPRRRAKRSVQRRGMPPPQVVYGQEYHSQQGRGNAGGPTRKERGSGDRERRQRRRRTGGIVRDIEQERHRRGGGRSEQQRQH